MERGVSKEWSLTPRRKDLSTEFPLDICAGFVDYPLATVCGGRRNEDAGLARLSGGESLAEAHNLHRPRWGYSVEKTA